MPSVSQAPSRPLSTCIFTSLFAALIACVAAAEDRAPLSLDEALKLAVDQSLQLTAQRYGVEAAQKSIVPARELPDSKVFFGVDNLPVTGPDAWSTTADFMTMRKIGVMQDFPRAQKRELKGQLAEHVAARDAAMLVDARAALRRDVATAWLQCYFAKRMSAVVGEQIGEMQLQRDAMRAGVKANKTALADLLAVDVSLQSLFDKRAQFDKDGARAQAMLSRWLGPAAERPLAEFTASARRSRKTI